MTMIDTRDRETVAIRITSPKGKQRVTTETGMIHNAEQLAHMQGLGYVIEELIVRTPLLPASYEDPRQRAYREQRARHTAALRQNDVV